MPFILAVLLNLSGILLLNLLLIPSEINKFTQTNPIQAKLKNLRQVGKKDSIKKIFTPTVGDPKASPLLKQRKTEASDKNTQKSSTAIKSLTLPKSQKGPLVSQTGPKALRTTKRQVQMNALLKQQVYDQKRQHGLIDDILQKSDFMLRPELPKGIPEDELNSIEKIYFSFQKRMYVQYLNTFISTYNEVKKENPLIKQSLRDGDHLLTSRVVFDREGNIISIKIIRSAPDDNIHELFEQTLRNIQKVPNPPDDFINSEDQFVIYYTLKVN